MSNLEVAKKNLEAVISLAFEHGPDHQALIIFDSRSELSKLLTEAYRACLTQADLLDFDQTTPDEILKIIATLKARDLVIMVQSTSFRLSEFRIRIELFQQGLKVIEHPHLARIQPDEVETYIQALEYDVSYYRGVGPKLKDKIDVAQNVVVKSGGEDLVYKSTFEPAKLNIGDYTGMKNIGGQFPIGEVFSEPKDLLGVNGRAQIFAFGDNSFKVNVVDKPITLVIKEGEIVEVQNSTPAFDEVITKIKADERLWVRELGFGMNRAFTRTKIVSDVGSYERMCGVHLSLGAKHTIYAKPDFKRKHGKHHVDVFVAVDQVEIDGESVFANGAWV